MDNKAIGLRIREEREKLKLSRDEFAEIIELSEYYVGQLERGERQMSLPTLVNIANTLHISLDYLVLGKTEHNNYYVHYENNIYETSACDIDKEINNLLNKCSPKELALIKKLVQTILPYIKNE
ncbi:helix-turn-helix transcriptional regulator [Pelotomaculum isophthalicicum JI]|uniref:Helix-turn-helix transcriptional regulator n=1 Tax=Pelotomaculum isophthalicicum JI TaxID=947010 RepID=A0A9X4H277_9FIRM|nr:helix-turn-helix transcriptional regulator [Pelotomaculum isophthalicicum]MDF9408655.1 helix-turn-helix transcriptional regulator [Pelotomaculum isophthalicicum JI]